MSDQHPHDDSGLGSSGESTVPPSSDRGQDTAANRKLWVEALRSGEFKQGQGWLRRDDAMCCLGVACEVFRRETGRGEWQRNMFWLDHHCRQQDLPAAVREWVGLSSSEGHFNPEDKRSRSSYLTSLNDRGESFTEIADVIESEPKGLLA